MDIFHSYVSDQRVNLHFPMGFLWVSYGFPMGFLWFSYEKPSIFSPSFGIFWGDARKHRPLETILCFPDSENYPAWLCQQLANLKMTIEIVDLPSYIAWWIFPVRYAKVDQAG